MDALEILRRSAENNAWANLRIHRACGRLTDREREERRTSFFPSILLTLRHILLVDLYYLDALVGGGQGRRIFQDEGRFSGFAVLRDAQRACDAELVGFTRALADEAALERIVGLERRDHEQRERVGDVLLHLYEHQVHHRGQVHAMLAGTEVAPPQLDEYFLAEELPLREAELRELGLLR